MHFNFHFTTVQVLWTLTFASLLVLLVVLLGRDRMRRFPWFTASIALVALRLLATRLLYNRLPQITMGAVFIVMANISALVGILVVVEMARRAFGRVTRRTWILGGLAVLAVGVGRVGSVARCKVPGLRYAACEVGDAAIAGPKDRTAG